MAEGRLGAQFVQFSSLLEFVLHHWSHPQFGIGSLNRNPCPDHGRPSMLHAVSFDKLGNLTARLWGVAYHETYDGKLGEDNDGKNDCVRRPCPFDTRRGLHGPGLCVVTETKRKPLFLLDVLTQLESLSGRKRIDVVSTKKTSGSISSDPKAYIAPANKHPDPSVVLNKFNAKEKEIAQDIAIAISHLNPNEIRVLGTHYSAEATLKDIDFELRWILKKMHNIENNAKQIRSGAIELIKKSHANRKDYENGYLRLDKELRADCLNNGFSKVQAKSAQIWDDSRIKQVALISNVVMGLVLLATGYANSLVPRDRECVLLAQNYLTSTGQSVKSAAIALEKICNELLAITNTPT